MRKRQMCKSANVQKTDVHKMRKSAAQIIFQMQKSQFRKSALCTILSVQVFVVHTFSFFVTEHFLHMRKKLL